MHRAGNSPYCNQTSGKATGLIMPMPLGQHPSTAANKMWQRQKCAVFYANAAARLSTPQACRGTNPTSKQSKRVNLLAPRRAISLSIPPTFMHAPSWKNAQKCATSFAGRDCGGTLPPQCMRRSCYRARRLPAPLATDLGPVLPLLLLPPRSLSAQSA